MKNIFLFSFVATALAFTIFSCSKNGATGATGPAGPLSTGTLSGYVTTLDEYGYKLNTAQGGVSIHLSDSSMDSTLTNSAGFYSISNIKTGVYSTLTYSANGFAPVVVNDYSFLGGGTILRNQSMSAYPSLSLFNISGTDTTIGTDMGLQIRGTDSAQQSPRSFIVFASTTSTVSSAPGNYTYVNTNGGIKATLSNWTLFVYAQDLHDSGLPSGSTVYFIVYPISTNAPTYIDPTTGKTVYTALGTPSPVFSIVIP
jgi:hypothetical protein